MATEPDDDVYDVCPNPTTVSGVNNIKAMFESSPQKQIPVKKPVKPPVLSKPPPTVPGTAEVKPVLPGKTHTQELRNAVVSKQLKPAPPAKAPETTKKPNYTDVLKLKKQPPALAEKKLPPPTAEKKNGVVTRVQWPPPPKPEELPDLGKEPATDEEASETVVVGHKKYKKTSLPTKTVVLPSKPALPASVDINDLRERFAAFEDEEFYDDVEVVVPEQKTKSSRPVTEIAEFTEEEELGQPTDEIYDDTAQEMQPPDEVYDDVANP